MKYAFSDVSEDHSSTQIYMNTQSSSERNHFNVMIYLTCKLLPLCMASSVNTYNQGRLMKSANTQTMATQHRYCLVVTTAASGLDIVRQRSMEMAIRVLTEAHTETPWKYATTLQQNTPSVHAELENKFVYLWNRLYSMYHLKLSIKQEVIKIWFYLFSNRQTLFLYSTCIEQKKFTDYLMYILFYYNITKYKISTRY